MDSGSQPNPCLFHPCIQPLYSPHEHRERVYSSAAERVRGTISICSQCTLHKEAGLMDLRNEQKITSIHIQVVWTILNDHYLLFQ